MEVSELLVFIHVPRTAGTTFVGILDRLYGRDAVLELYGSEPEAAWEGLTPEGAARIRVVVGHVAYGVHERLPMPCRYLTFLRDPVDRVISHYRYVRTQPGHYLHEVAMGMSLAGFVQSCGPYEPNNDQTRLWAGAERGPSDPEMLPVAKSNLEAAVVGLTAEFDASVMLMRRLLSWRLPLYVPRNVTRRRSDAAGPGPEVRELILARNALDVELYSFAAERFERQIGELGRRFAGEVGAFRAINALSRPLRASRAVVLGQQRDRGSAPPGSMPPGRATSGGD